MSRTDDFLGSAGEQDLVSVPMFLPREVFDFIVKAAEKRGKSPGTMINEIFFNELKKIAKEDGLSGGEG